MDDENISHDQLKYSACLLADMVEIEQNAAHHRKLMLKSPKKSLTMIIERHTL